jgi:hypothetical protein
MMVMTLKVSLRTRSERSPIPHFDCAKPEFQLTKNAGSSEIDRPLSFQY